MASKELGYENVKGCGGRKEAWGFEAFNEAFIWIYQRESVPPSEDPILELDFKTF
jgi:hypothetical protein